MITIIDYGMGNLSAIANMLKRAGSDAVITGEAGAVAKAGKLILPGVGAFDAGMDNLHRRGLVEPLRRRVLDEGAPLLGICLGMQLLTRRSDEGEKPGLGWIEADTLRFDLGDNPDNLKIPHMGWNTIAVSGSPPLFAGLEEDARFYFVHSFKVTCERPEEVLAVTHHGGEVAAAIGCGNIMGVQFHPEKSHAFGMRLLRNFVESY